MEDNSAFERDLASIHKLMERSVKFISLSGLAGILAGIYALIGAGSAYYLIRYPDSLGDYFPIRNEELLDESINLKLLFIAFAVLSLSLSTGVILSYRKAKKLGIEVWDEAGRRTLINLSIPLITGGLLILTFMLSGHVGILAALTLIFYGLALVNASPNLVDELRYLGYSEIVLGLLAAAIPGYGLLFWATGFGVLHIFYGVAMYRKYDP